MSDIKIEPSTPVTTHTDTTSGSSLSSFSETKETKKKPKQNIYYKPYPSVEPRKEIVSFFGTDNERQASLFVQAFSLVQQFSTWDLRSFYRIGGIHGLPYEPYGDDTGVPDDEDIAADNRWWGYCQHGTVLFPTWHRPYIRLLEQTIRDQALIVAQNYSQDADAADWEKAANTLRFPYFDWESITTKDNGVPYVFTDVKIKIRNNINDDGKTASYREVANPLRAFTLPADLGSVITSSDQYNPTQRPYLISEDYLPYTPKGYATIRHPTSDYKSDDKTMNEQFKKLAIETWRTGMWHVFQISDYQKFSNHTESEKDNGYSLESIHDSVHGAVGGNGGHMSYPSIAGLDPIFFFHHCNVDRMFAIWQACHPGSWMDKEYDPGAGTRVIDPTKDKLSAKTPLVPFRMNEKGQYFTSNDIRDVKKLGYSYPDLTGEGPSFLQKILNDYKPLVGPETKRLLVNFNGIEKRKLGGPFSMRVFVGDPKHLESINADNKWVNTPNFAGSVHVFARSKVEGCPTCRTYTHARAAVDVTAAVVLSKLELKDEKTPLAKGQVKVVVVRQDGQQVSLKEAGVPEPQGQLWVADDTKEVTPPPAEVPVTTSTHPSVPRFSLASHAPLSHVRSLKLQQSWAL